MTSNISIGMLKLGKNYPNYIQYDDIHNPNKLPNLLHWAFTPNQHITNISLLGKQILGIHNPNNILNLLY